MQRKQSLWLFLSALLILLTFFIPYGIQSASNIGAAQLETLLSAKTNFLLAVLVIASSLLANFIIFLHANRKLQKRLTVLLTTLFILIAVYMFYDANLTDANKKLAVGIVGSTLYIGILFPIMSAVLSMMAYSGIRNDEKLIQSMDRLR